MPNGIFFTQRTRQTAASSDVQSLECLVSKGCHLDHVVQHPMSCSCHDIPRSDERRPHMPTNTKRLLAATCKPHTPGPGLM